MTAAQRAWREANRDHLNAYNRRQRAAKRAADPVAARAANRSKSLRRYGLTVVAWEALFDSQGRRCAICSSMTSGDGRWHTDHDASVGYTAVRGILCVRCNIGIGQLDHDSVRLRSAINYLQRGI